MKRLIGILQHKLGITDQTSLLARSTVTGWADIGSETANLAHASAHVHPAPAIRSDQQNGTRVGIVDAGNGVMEPEGAHRDTRKSTTPAQHGPLHGDIIGLRLLVLSADRNDPNFAAITELLDYIGIPYDSHFTQTQRLARNQLFQGSTAYYQGIILATARGGQWRADLARWIDTLEPEEEEHIRAFCQRFGVRRLTFFCPPGTEIGPVSGPESTAEGRFLASFIDPDTVEGSPSLRLTAAGHAIFNYLRPDCILPVAPLAAAFFPLDGALDRAADANGPTTPQRVHTEALLTTHNDRPCVMQMTYPEGDEELIVGLAHAADALHTLLLGYGLVNWVTRGLFVGQRRVYLNIQVDDIFNATQLWNPVEESPAGETYRLTAEDIDAVVDWLARMRRHPLVDRGFTIDLAFNGGGIEPASRRDALAENLMRHQDWFRWINHGYTHLNLNTAGLDECFSEIQQNHLAALTLGLDAYSTDSMVTSEISGLDNPRFLFAAKSLGIRYLVSDTSRPGWNNPAPNVGNHSRFQPEILVIPRHPTNLLYDVSTPTDWASRYNAIYRDYWGRALNHAEVLEREADTMLGYLLRFDLDPIMFHQANLRSYDGTHTLLTDLLERVIEKYADYYTQTPIQSLSMHEIGERMALRAQCRAANIRASLLVGNGLIVTADRAVTLSVTGLHLEGASEHYAGQHQSTISLRAGETYRVPALNVVGFQLE